MIHDTKDQEHIDKGADEYRLVALQQDEALKRFRTRKSSTTVGSTARHLQSTESRASTKRSATNSSDYSLRSQNDMNNNIRKRGRHMEHQRRRNSVLLMDIENQLAVPRRWNENDNEGNIIEVKNDSDDDTISQRHDSRLEHQERPPKTPLIIKVRYKIWSFLHSLTKYEVKFAIKTAVAVTSLCIPAFVPESNAWFIRDRGQWASVTVIAIMNPTRYVKNIYMLIISEPHIII